MALLQSGPSTLQLNDCKRLADGITKTNVSHRENADTTKRVFAPPAQGAEGRTCQTVQ